MPSTMEDAIKKLSLWNDSFYVNDKSRNTHYSSYVAESDEQEKSAPTANHQGRNTRGPMPLSVSNVAECVTGPKCAPTG
jgi:hypothetical protein